jgi:hypothetical protein
MEMRSQNLRESGVKFIGEIEEIPPSNFEEDSTKHRDMMRMYRKARKLAYEIRGPWRKPEKPGKDAKRVYRAYITVL